MPLYVKNKIPNFRTPFWVLKTERIVYTIWLCPHDEGV
jgi:hypothetical protein